MLMPSIFGENLFDEFFGDWDRDAANGSPAVWQERRPRNEDGCA